MLFWPGVAGQFMGNLPVTIIFVLSASLIVVLIYLPVVGGVTGRISRKMESIANKIQNTINLYLRIILFACICLLSIFTAYLLLKSLFIDINKNSALALMFIFFIECICLSTLITSFKLQKMKKLLNIKIIFRKGFLFSCW